MKINVRNNTRMMYLTQLTILIILSAFSLSIFCVNGGILSEVLRDMREQGRCYIKYEVKQGCFHMTVR